MKIWTNEEFDTALNRAEMAASVELPVEDFRSLILLAKKAHNLEQELYLLKPLPPEMGGAASPATSCKCDSLARALENMINRVEAYQKEFGSDLTTLCYLPTAKQALSEHRKSIQEGS